MDNKKSVDCRPSPARLFLEWGVSALAGGGTYWLLDWADGTPDWVRALVIGVFFGIFSV